MLGMNMGIVFNLKNGGGYIFPLSVYALVYGLYYTVGLLIRIK